MKKIFIGWSAQPFPRYIDVLTALGAPIEREDPDGCAALLLPGGADIHPRFYGQAVNGARDIDEARDTYEFAVFRRFFDTGKPIFGVCRGMQLINIALGGTLLQHIGGHDQIAEDVFDTHSVHTDDELLLRLGGERFVVNSAHHQAVDRLGAGLRAVAWADDGIVEAIRHETRPIFGVQWHPERLDAGAILLGEFLKTL